MTNHPDWMYELYRESFTRTKVTTAEWDKKKPEEKGVCPLNFKYSDGAHLHWLESKGLI